MYTHVLGFDVVGGGKVVVVVVDVTLGFPGSAKTENDDFIKRI